MPFFTYIHNIFILKLRSKFTFKKSSTQNIVIGFKIVYFRKMQTKCLCNLFFILRNHWPLGQCAVFRTIVLRPDGIGDTTCKNIHMHKCIKPRLHGSITNEWNYGLVVLYYCTYTIIHMVKLSFIFLNYILHKPFFF